MPGSPPSKFPRRFLRIPEHEPPREAHILILTTKPFRFEKPPPQFSQTTTQSGQEHHPPSFRCVLHCSNNTATKPKSNDAKSPTHQVSGVFLRIPANEPPRAAHILTLTMRAHRCQQKHPHTHTHKPQPNQAKSTTQQVSSVCCTVQTTRPPSQHPKMPRALPTKFPLCFWNSSKRTTVSSSHPHIDD
jgi:hypothetical protein